MKIGEAAGYLVLAGGGILIFKLLGGIKGLQDVFAGAGELFKQPTFLDPKEILTETEQFEKQYTELTIPAQELAQAKVSVEQVKEALPTSPEYQYLSFIEDYFGWVPFIGDIAKTTTAAVETKLGGVERAAELEYMKTTTPSMPVESPHVETGITGKGAELIEQYKTGVGIAKDWFYEKYGRYPGE